jgi:hypothetical protein
MKKILQKFLVSLAAVALVSGNFASAQEKAVQKALENVKDRVDDLITAKDENSPNAVALRIETFKKVIELSVSEAKDLKIKLLSLDSPKDEAIIAWQKAMIDGLDSALEYYNTQRTLLEKNPPTSVVQIKDLAEQFKEWREKNYLPLATQISDFILINQEQKAIEVAKKRADKIGGDLANLKKSKNAVILKNLAVLENFLSSARKLIAEASETNLVANRLFFEQYLAAYLPQPEDANNASSSIESVESQSAETAQLATSTAVFSPPSIKDLVKESLSKIRTAYQIFIEMSNLVRKLLS